MSQQYVRLDTPCDTCGNPEECWNYGKKPDPTKPGGPFVIDGWFDCDKQSQAERSMNKTVDDRIHLLEKDIQDLRAILTLIAFQQEDKTLHISVQDLLKMPPRMELITHFDAASDRYILTAAEAANEPAPTPRKVFPH